MDASRIVKMRDFDVNSFSSCGCSLMFFFELACKRDDMNLLILSGVAESPRFDTSRMRENAITASCSQMGLS